MTDDFRAPADFAREADGGSADGWPPGADPDWRVTLERNFRQWLQEVEADPSAAVPAAEDGPDLYAFYEALCVVRTEVRHQARRSHESLGRFGEALAGFEELLRTLNQRVIQIDGERGGLDDAGLHALLLSLVELFERFKRVQERMRTPPATGWFPSHRRWAAVWSALREGFDILNDHFQQLLQNQGVTVIGCKGRAFDPTLMKAVAVRQTASVPANTVLAQLSGGYSYRGRVLKFAEVKIAVGKEKS
ncbi:MAG: nucleotide exchange factor GrpE [Desulfobacterales bacterium]|nr:nucleotide exchange factor GrpE [Desulfobacterales bacterium]